MTTLTHKNLEPETPNDQDIELAREAGPRLATLAEKGHVVETALSSAIFKSPEHAYTRKLMRATPRPGITLRDLLPEEESKRPKAIALPAEAKAAAKSVDGVETPLLVVETSQFDSDASDESLDDLVKQITGMGGGTRYYVPRTK